MGVFAMEVSWAAALVACGLLVHLLLKYYEFRRCELAIPGPPSTLFLGNALDFAGVTEATVFPTLIQLWGGRRELSRFSMLNRLIVFVSDPNDLASVFRSKEFNYKPPMGYEFLEHIAPTGLVVVNGPEWKRHRMAAQPAFHHEVLDSYDEIFSEEAENFVKKIVPNEEQDPQDSIYYMTACSFIRTAMVSDQNDKQILMDLINTAKLFLRTLNERTFKPWLWSNWIFEQTALAKVLRKGVDKVRVFVIQKTNQRREKLNSQTTPKAEDFLKRRKTFLDVLIDAQMEQKIASKLDNKHIMDEIVIFGGAALETSTSTIAHTFKCLSLYPDVQERLYAEVKEVLGNTKRSVTMDDVARMPYLDQVIKETMRVLPPIPFVGRLVREKTVFAGKVLPAGATLFLNFYGAHRDPQHWDEPLRFNPDRFADSEGRHPYAFVPFSAGPRNCIGYRYATQLVKTTLATTLRDYRVDRADDGITDHNQLPLTFDLALHIVGGAPVVFTPRES